MNYNIGDFLVCINSVHGFTKGKKYQLLDGGVDCYSNTEVVFRNDKGKGYFICTKEFFDVFGKIPKDDRWMISPPIKEQ